MKPETHKGWNVWRAFTASEYSVLSTIFGKPSPQSFMKANTARSTNVAKLSKFANMKLNLHLAFFYECFTKLFHSIFGQLYLDFCVFVFVSPECPPLYYFGARTLVVLSHGVLANWLVECFSLVVPNMVLSKLNIQKLVSQHTRGRYKFQPLWLLEY